MMTEQLLDQYADFCAQVDLLELQRREMMEAVKIPAEVQAIHDEGVKRKAAVDAEYRNAIMLLDEDKRLALADVVIPDEIRAALAAIDAKRREIEFDNEAKKRREAEEAEKRKAAIDNEFSAKVAGIYEEVATRKQEISAEFTGKAETAKANIAKLEAQIKSETIKEECTQKGQYYMAVYSAGRITWNTDKLEGMIAIIPQIADARKVGAPSVAIRKR